MSLYWTITNLGVEKPIADWGIDDLDATFVNQAEDEVTLSANGRKFDAAYLFPYKSTVIIRRDRVRDGSGFSGGSFYFTGIVAYPHVGASGRREFQQCSIVGPWWFLNERGFEQEYKQVVSVASNGDVTLKTPNPTRSRIFLNLALGEYGQVLFNKLNTGQQLTEILNWTLKPFVDASAPPPFQIGSIGIAVDPPVDEVKNITCAEAARKMFRWSPDCVAWFDHTTSPPTFHVARAAALTTVNVDIGTLKPTSIGITPRHDLQRSFVRIQYERINTINGASFPQTIEDVWPNPIPTGALDQFGGVPFVIDLRGYVSNTTIATIKTTPINIASNDWWIANEPSLIAGMENGSIDSVVIDQGDPLAVDYATKKPRIKTEVGEDDLNLPNLLVDGSPTDWIPRESNTNLPARYQRVTATCRAHIISKNKSQQRDRTLTFQFTATDAITGSYATTAGSEAGDDVPVNLARDFYDAVSRLIYEGSISFREFELGGTPRLGQKFNLLGCANAAWQTMATPVQRVRENIHRRTCTVEFGTPPHLDLNDLVSLFRVTRNRDPQNPYSLRSGGGSGGGRSTPLPRHSVRHNSGNASGNYEKIVASGSADPGEETDDAKMGKLTLDSLEKEFIIVGGGMDGEIKLKLGRGLESCMGRRIVLQETEGCDPATGQKMYCIMLRSVWYPTPVTTTFGQ